MKFSKNNPPYYTDDCCSDPGECPSFIISCCDNICPTELTIRPLWCLSEMLDHRGHWLCDDYCCCIVLSRIYKRMIGIRQVDIDETVAVRKYSVGIRAFAQPKSYTRTRIFAYEIRMKLILLVLGVSTIRTIPPNHFQPLP